MSDSRMDIDSDVLSDASTVQSEARSDYDVECILAEEPDDTSGLPLYLTKWDGYQILRSTWEPASSFGDDATALRQWQDRKQRTQRGLEPAFDVRKWQADCVRDAAITADRKARRRERRRLLGKRSVPSDDDKNSYRKRTQFNKDENTQTSEASIKATIDASLFGGLTNEQQRRTTGEAKAGGEAAGSTSTSGNTSLPISGGLSSGVSSRPRLGLSSRSAGPTSPTGRPDSIASGLLRQPKGLPARQPKQSKSSNRTEFVANAGRGPSGRAPAAGSGPKSKTKGTNATGLYKTPVTSYWGGRYRQQEPRPDSDAIKLVPASEPGRLRRDRIRSAAPSFSQVQGYSDQQATEKENQREREEVEVTRKAEEARKAEERANRELWLTNAARADEQMRQDKDDAGRARRCVIDDTGEVMEDIEKANQQDCSARQFQRSTDQSETHAPAQKKKGMSMAEYSRLKTLEAGKSQETRDRVTHEQNGPPAETMPPIKGLVCLGSDSVVAGEVNLQAFDQDLLQQIKTHCQGSLRLTFETVSKAQDLETFLKEGGLDLVISCPVTPIPLYQNPPLSAILNALSLFVCAGIICFPGSILIIFPRGDSNFKFLYSSPEPTPTKAENGLSFQLRRADTGKRLIHRPLAAIFPPAFLYDMVDMLTRMDVKSLLPKPSREGQEVRNFFLLFPGIEDFRLEIAVVVQYLRRFAPATIAFNRTPGAWEDWASKVEAGVVLAHPSFHHFHVLSALAAVFHKNVCFFEFGTLHPSPIPFLRSLPAPAKADPQRPYPDPSVIISTSHPPNFLLGPIFPPHTLHLYLPTHLLTDYPHLAKEVLEWFEAEHKASNPTLDTTPTYKLLVRPNLADWLHSYSYERFHSVPIAGPPKDREKLVKEQQPELFQELIARFDCYFIVDRLIYPRAHLMHWPPIEHKERMLVPKRECPVQWRDFPDFTDEKLDSWVGAHTLTQREWSRHLVVVTRAEDKAKDEQRWKDMNLHHAEVLTIGEIREKFSRKR